MTQETIAWGWFAWKSGSTSSSPITLDFLNDVGGVQQIVCAERVMTCLAGNGKVYIVSYTSEAAVCLIRNSFTAGPDKSLAR